MNKTEVVEKTIEIAKRVPPGDRCQLKGEKEIKESLTETLEAYFQKTGKPAEFRLAPLKGKLYVITTEEQEIVKPEPKKFSIYGDYEFE